MTKRPIQKVLGRGPRPAELGGPTTLARLQGSLQVLNGFERVRPLALTDGEVDRVLPVGSTGRYLVGHCDARGSFRIQFAGCSERDLNSTLKAHVGLYREFKVIADAAFAAKVHGRSYG